MTLREAAVLYSRAEISSITLVGVPHQARRLQPLQAPAPVSEGTNLELLQRTQMVLGIVDGGMVVVVVVMVVVVMAVMVMPLKTIKVVRAGSFKYWAQGYTLRSQLAVT